MNLFVRAYLNFLEKYLNKGAYLMFMNKKGVQLSIQTMILIVLGLIVLVLLIWIIRGQISKGGSQYFNISETAAGEAKMDKCKSGFFTRRQCAGSCGSIVDDYFWHNIGKLDCKTGTCCERGDIKPPELRPKTDEKKETDKKS